MSSPAWEPRIGERVRIVATSRTGTIVHLTQTEWGLLCDVATDAPPDAASSGATSPERRTYTTGELEPLS